MITQKNNLEHFGLRQHCGWPFIAIIGYCYYERAIKIKTIKKAHKVVEAGEKFLLLFWLSQLDSIWKHKNVFNCANGLSTISRNDRASVWMEKSRDCLPLGPKKNWRFAEPLIEIKSEFLWFAFASKLAARSVEL
jgi:hypothetical protein